MSVVVLACNPGIHEDQKFKVILNYLAKRGPVGLQETVSKQQTPTNVYRPITC